MESETGFDNSGRGPLVVPGVGDLPANLSFCEPTFTSTYDWPNPRELHLTVRELSMLEAMNKISELPDWHLKIFDSEEVSKWQKILTAEDELLSPSAWDWCMKELRDKATHATHGVLVYDTDTGVYKSDAVAIANDFKHNAVNLVPPTEFRDWEPGSRNQVLNLVDPLLFPMIYGRTPVLANGGSVGLNDCFNYYGHGETVPQPSTDEVSEQQELPDEVHPHWCTLDKRSQAKLYSANFQRLPCDIEFVDESGKDVRIASYVNNLHPVAFGALYGSIAKVISASIEPWNKVLVHGNKGRKPRRVKTYGVEWEPPFPEWATDEVFDFGWEEDGTSSRYQSVVAKVHEYLSLLETPPARPQPGASTEIIADWGERRHSEARMSFSTAVRNKWNRLRSWKHPEPGLSYTYEEWKEGKTGKAIIKRIQRCEIERVFPYPEPSHEFYEVSLQEQFRKQGLQVIVKIDGIELTPERHHYDGGNWQLEATGNEHIAATATFFYDVENVTNARVFFRQETDMEWLECFEYLMGEPHALGEVFGIPWTDDYIEKMESYDGTFEQLKSIQERGSVAIKHGRHLAWPWQVEHRVGPFSLADRARPGHLRFITLHLVDPYYRIISTRNVPPQRHDWWWASAMEAMATKIPAELISHIDRETENWPIGISEAQEVRRRFRDERRDARSHVEEKCHVIDILDVITMGVYVPTREPLETALQANGI